LDFFLKFLGFYGTLSTNVFLWLKSPKNDLGFEPFTLAKYVMDVKCNTDQVCCAICSKIKGKEKLLMFKLDNLLQHSSYHKGNGCNSLGQGRFIIFQT
jgi:hypothetical protein